MPKDEFLSNQELFGMTPKKAAEIREMMRGYALGAPRRFFYSLKDSLKYGVGGAVLVGASYSLWEGFKYLIGQYNANIAGFISGIATSVETINSITNNVADYVSNDLLTQINSPVASIGGFLASAFLIRLIYRKLSREKRQNVFRTEPGFNLRQFVGVPIQAARQVVGMYPHLQNTVPFLLLEDFCEVQEVSSRNPGFNEKPIFDFDKVEYRQLEDAEQTPSRSGLEDKVIDVAPLPSPTPARQLPYGRGDLPERRG